MGKRYSPVRVSNPSSKNYLVPLYPNQSFSLYLSSWYDLVDIDWKSDFFEIASKICNKDGSIELFFDQKYDLADWSDISNFFLGEVALIGNYTSSLCVYLKASNPHKDIVFTVLDPSGYQVKVNANQILEVIACDPYLKNEIWDCEIHPSKEGLEFEQIDYKVVSPYSSPNPINDPKDLCCLLPRSMDYSEEHHFWFRLTADSITILSNSYDGIYSGGKIVLNSHRSSRNLNVQIRFCEKSKDRYWKSLLLPRKCFSDSLTSKRYSKSRKYKRWWERSASAKEHMQQEIHFEKKVSIICN